MEYALIAFEFIKLNGPAIVAVILATLTLAESIVRLTPTKTDDGAVERVGALIRKAFNFLKIPNNIKVKPPEVPEIK